MNAVVEKMNPVDSWRGCYDSGWQSEIVAEDFSSRIWHGWQTPTKFLRYEASRR